MKLWFVRDVYLQTMKTNTLLWASSLLALAISCSEAEDASKVDRVFTNGILVTPDSTVEGYSIAVMDGKIIDFRKGENATWSGEQVDLKGAYVYAGFIDAHAHFVGYAKGLQSVDLIGTTSWNEVVERTRTFADENPSFNFITGRGWDQNDWGDQTDFPNNQVLNELFPNIPVVLTRVDGHAVIANDAALALGGIHAGITVDGGSVIIENGKPTGVLIDNASSLIQYPEISNQQLADALMEAEGNCFAVGLTTLDDAGLSQPMIAFIDSLQQNDLLKMRIYAMVSDDPRWIAHYINHGKYKTDRLNVRSFKFYGDGALGSRGACLRLPYHDAPDENGFMLSKIEHFRESAKLLAGIGFQMNTHAIGDSANLAILDVYESVLKGDTVNRRWRIEHAQVLSEEDLFRFSKLNVIPSVQPTHATSDMYWAEDRLGADRLEHAYAYGRMVNLGNVVPLGTDFPVEHISPIFTFYAAVARKDHSGFPEGGFQSRDAMTREDALRGMTIWAAYSNFEENEKGSLKPGKFADFTILDTDLIHCPEDEILDAQVLLTVVNGEVVYTNEEFSNYE